MGHTLQSSASESSRGHAPVTARRRATAQFPGLSTRPKADEVPVLIRLPNLAKYSQKGNAETLVKPAPQTPVDSAEQDISENLLDTETAESVVSVATASTATKLDAAASNLSRAEQRRRRRQPEPAPAANWKPLAIQWGVIVAVVVVVSIAFHLLQGNNASKTAAEKSAQVQSDEPSAYASTATASPTVVDGAASPNAPLEPAPLIEEFPARRETPSVNSPTSGEPTPAQPLGVIDSSANNPPRQPPAMDANYPLLVNQDRGNVVNEPNASPERSMSLPQYPTTDPSTYLYRPGSTANPGNLPVDALGRDGQTSPPPAGAGFDNGGFPEDGIRSARIRGIQPLPTRDRR